MKPTSFEKLKTHYLGKKGTEHRDNYERELSKIKKPTFPKLYDWLFRGRKRAIVKAVWEAEQKLRTELELDFQEKINLLQMESKRVVVKQSFAKSYPILHIPLFGNESPIEPTEPNATAEYSMQRLERKSIRYNQSLGSSRVPMVKIQHAIKRGLMDHIFDLGFVEITIEGNYATARLNYFE